MVQLQHIQSHKDLFTCLLSFNTGATSPCTYMYVHIHQQIQVFRNWVHKHIRDFIRSVCTIYGGHGKNLMKVKYLGRKRGGACIPKPPDLPDPISCPPIYPQILIMFTYHLFNATNTQHRHLESHKCLLQISNKKINTSDNVSNSGQSGSHH